MYNGLNSSRRHKKRVNRSAVRKQDVNAGQGYLGVVKNWLTNKGYGFIHMGEDSVFVHMTQILDERDELEKGETVYFELQQDDQGRLSAKHVKSWDNLSMPQIQYVQGPTGQIFAVPINPMQQQQQQLLIQKYNDMLMIQNQANLQRHSPELQAVNSVVSEVPTLPTLSPELSATAVASGDVKLDNNPYLAAPAQASPGAEQENQQPPGLSLSPPQLVFQDQAQHIQQLQMFQLAAQQQHLQSQRVVLFPMSLAQNVMLNQPTTVLPSGLIQTIPNVPATKKANQQGRQQKTNQGPVSHAGHTHSFYKAFKPY